MADFSGRAANEELEAMAADYLKQAHAWLHKWEPALLAARGDGAAVDAALQGLANAELTRAEQNGVPMICALAHQLAIFFVQFDAEERPHRWAMFTTKVSEQLEEIHGHMRPQGSA